jgi:NADH:ubiquinone oxidoreductase subunit F (NADH-binding)
MEYMAGQSAAQCGPCVSGLRATADVTSRIANGRGTSDNLARRVGQLAGRGACRHPDEAVGLLLDHAVRAVDVCPLLALHLRAVAASRAA